jgi:hypothetical protein
MTAGSRGLEVVRHSVVMKVAPRVLTDDEEGVLGALLAVDFPGSKELRQQAKHVRVVGRCDCGCATVDLEVLGGPAAPDADHQPVEATFLTGSGDPAPFVLLFVTDGWLKSMPVWEPGRPWSPDRRGGRSTRSVPQAPVALARHHCLPVRRPLVCAVQPCDPLQR